MISSDYLSHYLFYNSTTSTESLVFKVQYNIIIINELCSNFAYDCCNLCPLVIQTVYSQSIKLLLSLQVIAQDKQSHLALGSYSLSVISKVLHEVDFYSLKLMKRINLLSDLMVLESIKLNYHINLSAFTK